jgi:aldoxime dehydratase
LLVKAPDNLCFIRTPQYWSDCQGEKRTTYLDTVAPVLAEGVRFLRDAPLESGCCAGRFLRECDLKTGGPIDKTCMAAYFLSLGHLERWAKRHSSHLAIFDSFMQMVQKHNFQISLKLWHEVWVVPGCNLHIEYNNCHPAMGLLP